MDGSISSQHLSESFCMDFYDSLPIGYAIKNNKRVAFINSECKVKYMNRKTSEMFKMSKSDIQLLSEYL